MAKQKVVVGQLDQETMQDYIKFRVFLALGASRDLGAAFKKYYETNNEASPMWMALANKFHWVDRANEHDKANAVPAK
jgi:hypothetical protein